MIYVEEFRIKEFVRDLSMQRTWYLSSYLIKIQEADEEISES